MSDLLDSRGSEMIAYEEAVAAFRPEDIHEQLRGSLADGINACVECCDRWADDPGRIALKWEPDYA